MRVLICSSNGLFGQCLKIGLAAEPGVEFAEACSDLSVMIGLADAKRVSSVLLDLQGLDGEDGVRRLAHSLPDVCVLALSVDDHDSSEVLGCARLGCHGIIPREAMLKDVAVIIRRAERGEVSFRPEVSARMMRALAEAPPQMSGPDLTDCLTRREREICSLAAEGLTNKEIARQVNRSEGTVKNHVRSILTKLELPRRGALGAYLANCRSGAGPSAYPFAATATGRAQG